MVLDLGPGAGTQLDRFNSARIAHIYGVEPNTAFAPAFTDRLRELGQEDKYTLVSCGVEDGEVLARFGVVEGSIDCVVSMQVLVSPTPPLLLSRARLNWMAFGNARWARSALSQTRRSRPSICIGS